MRMVFDAGPLISLENTCMLWVLESLPYEFYVPKGVYSELVLNPGRTKAHLLSSIRIKRLFDIGRVKVAQADPNTVERILHLANNAFFHHGRPLKILHRGEAEALALAQGMDKVVCLDERTARALVEDPHSLERRLRGKFGAVHTRKENLDELLELIGDILVIRSTELLAYAYEVGNFIYGRDLEALRGALYALKFAGCAVSEDEIEWYLRSILEKRRKPIWKQ